MKQFDPIFFTPPSGKTTAPRTLYKGGGGGDGGAAARKAAEDARIASSIRKLNEVFGLAEATPDPVDRNRFTTRTPASNSNNALWRVYGVPQPQSNDDQITFDEAGYNAAVKAAQDKANSLRGAGEARENLYKKIGTDATNTALLDLNRERGITERDLNFGLARAGLSGGSRDIDANREVLDTYQQGVLKASNIGLQTGNNARSNDEKTRVNLINSIHAGLSDGDATAQAYTAMSNNARSAADDANSASLAGFFDVLKQQQAQAQYNQGVNSVPAAAPFQQQRNTPSATKSFGGKIGSF